MNGPGGSDARNDPYKALTLQGNHSNEAKTPALRYAAWKSQLGGAHLRKPEDARVFFERTAHGRAPTYGVPLAHQVFNDLIEHEAYDLFAEVFTAYNEVQRTQPQFGGQPFHTMLALELPEDWAPSVEKEKAMVEAFRRIQVELLIVMGPPEGNPGAGLLVPAAVSKCVEALLREKKCGVTELRVECAMTDTASVANALPASNLNTIKMGDSLSRSPDSVLTEQELNTYKTLMKGFATCSTLERLTFRHRDLVCLASDIEQFDGPALVSVALECDALVISDIDDTSQLVQESFGAHEPVFAHPMERFMAAVARFQTLSEVVVHATLDSVDALSTIFLRPLEGHKALTRLEIKCPEDDHSTDTTDVLPTVIEFAFSCPRLTHFTWDCGLATLVDSEELRREIQKWLDRAVTKGDALELMKRRLNDKNLALKYLTLNGMRPSPQDLKILFGALSEDSRLEYLDLSGGLMNLLLAHGLPEALKNNHWLKTFLLPLKPICYYLGGDGQSIYRLAAQLDTLLFATEGLSLVLPMASSSDRNDLTAAEDALAAMALQAPLESVPTAPQAQLFANQWRLHGHVAYNEMAVDVARLFASSPSVRADLNTDVAALIVARLDAQGAFGDVLQLSAVNKATDHRKLHVPGVSAATVMPESVKAIVQLNKEKALNKPAPADSSGSDGEDA